MKLEWYIARRYLSSRRGTRFLSLITLIAIGGVAVGVMALIVVTSVMTGLQRDLRDLILGTNPHIWLTTYGESMQMDNWRELLPRVQNIAGVTGVAPWVQAEVGLANAAGHAEGALLRGIDPDGAGDPITDIARDVRAGKFQLGATSSGYPPLLVGSGLANSFTLFAGDTVTVISIGSAQISSFGTLQPKLRKFEVVGRFETGMYEYDTKFVYTTLAAAQDIAGLGNGASGLEIRVDDPMSATAVGRRIEDGLGGFPYRANDWQQMNSSLFSALKLEKFAMMVILLLIVVVAAFNIISTLVMVVTDKTREIGILKSMGLTGRQVRRVFMIQGLLIGAVGAALGSAGGVLLVWLLDRYEFIKIPGDVYFIDHLPVALDFADVAVILASSILIALLATIYPARQAAALLPVEAIRHD